MNSKTPHAGRSDTNTQAFTDDAARDELQQRLRALPDTPPPSAVWRRIERQARAEGLIGTSAAANLTRWFAAAAAAAVVVLALLTLPFGAREGGVGDAGPAVARQESDNDVPTRFRTEPVYKPSASEAMDSTLEATRHASINALMVQSQLLEADLRRLPNQPEVARAGILATIADLESRVAAIDHRLNDPQASLDTKQRQQLWRERVRLMDSLLSLRYAQSRRFSF